MQAQRDAIGIRVKAKAREVRICNGPIPNTPAPRLLQDKKVADARARVQAAETKLRDFEKEVASRYGSSL
jgi:hypothetical protein